MLLAQTSLENGYVHLLDFKPEVAKEKRPVEGLFLFWAYSFRLGTEYWTSWAPKVGRIKHRGLDEGWVPQIGRVLGGKSVVSWIFGVRCW